MEQIGSKEKEFINEILMNILMNIHEYSHESWDGRSDTVSEVGLYKVELYKVGL